MNRTFIRRVQQSAGCGRENPEQVNIGVTGLGRSVGTTFVATSLAFYFAEKGNCVTYCQCLTPSEADKLLYDAAAMEQRFACRRFYDIYRMIFEGKPVRGKKNMEKEISWILPGPWSCEEKADLDENQKARLIAGATGEICIFDFAAESRWDEFLMDMDRLIVVVDPLPSKLIRNSRRFAMLKGLEVSGMPLKWIVNRAGSGINRRQVSAYLKTRNLLWLPEISAQLFYADEFACRFSWENKEIRSQILPIFTKVSQ